MRRFLLLAATVLATASGCEALDDLFDSFLVEDCGTEQVPSDVAGAWTIVGEGSRSACNDERLDGVFELRSSTLDVEQSDDPSDTNLDNLALATPIEVRGGSFAFGGTVRGTCVDFQTVETSGTGAGLTYEFDGTFLDGLVTGEFEATGPSGCESSGTFQVTIR